MGNFTLVVHKKWPLCEQIILEIIKKQCYSGGGNAISQNWVKWKMFKNQQNLNGNELCV
jgi:hypothetical protein